MIYPLTWWCLVRFTEEGNRLRFRKTPGKGLENNGYVPISGKPQGPGGRLETVASQTAFPQRKTQIRRHRCSSCPGQEILSLMENEILCIIVRPKKSVHLSCLVPSSSLHTLSVQGSNDLKRYGLNTKYANKLFTLHWIPIYLSATITLFCQ